VAVIQGVIMKYTLADWGSDQSLLTGGRCFEVAINTGLTVIAKTLLNFFRFSVIHFFAIFTLFN
jgi:hypothetical protein